MNRAIIAAVALAGGVATALSAESVTTLTLTGRAGEVWTFAVEGLELRPQGKQLVVSSPSQSAVAIDMDALAGARFSASSTSGVEATATAEGTVTVWSLQGAALESFSSIGEAEHSLPAGLYVVVTASGTVKLSVR